MQSNPILSSTTTTEQSIEDLRKQFAHLIAGLPKTENTAFRLSIEKPNSSPLIAISSTNITTTNACSSQQLFSLSLDILKFLNEPNLCKLFVPYLAKNATICNCATFNENNQGYQFIALCLYAKKNAQNYQLQEDLKQVLINLAYNFKRELMSLPNSININDNSYRQNLAVILASLNIVTGKISEDNLKVYVTSLIWEQTEAILNDTNFPFIKPKNIATQQPSDTTYPPPHPLVPHNNSTNDGDSPDSLPMTTIQSAKSKTFRERIHSLTNSEIPYLLMLFSEAACEIGELAWGNSEIAKISTDLTDPLSGDRTALLKIGCDPKIQPNPSCQDLAKTAEVFIREVLKSALDARSKFAMVKTVLWYGNFFGYIHPIAYQIAILGALATNFMTANSTKKTLSNNSSSTPLVHSNHLQSCVGHIFNKFKEFGLDLITSPTKVANLIAIIYMNIMAGTRSESISDTVQDIVMQPISPQLDKQYQTCGTHGCVADALQRCIEMSANALMSTEAIAKNAGIVAFAFVGLSFAIRGAKSLYSWYNNKNTINKLSLRRDSLSPSVANIPQATPHITRSTPKNSSSSGCCSFFSSLFHRRHDMIGQEKSSLNPLSAVNYGTANLQSPLIPPSQKQQPAAGGNNIERVGTPLAHMGAGTQPSTTTSMSSTTASTNASGTMSVNNVPGSIVSGGVGNP